MRTWVGAFFGRLVLLNRLQPGSMVGTFTAKEAEDFYSKWVEMVAERSGPFSSKALRWRRAIFRQVER